MNNNVNNYLSFSPNISAGTYKRDNTIFLKLGSIWSKRDFKEYVLSCYLPCPKFLTLNVTNKWEMLLIGLQNKPKGENVRKGWISKHKGEIRGSKGGKKFFEFTLFTAKQKKFIFARKIHSNEDVLLKI